MSLLILSSPDADHIVSKFTLTDLQTLMARVFQSISRSPSLNRDSTIPHRASIQMTDHTALFMPARLVSHLPPPILQGTALKIVSVPRNSGDTRGLPASTIVLDESTGAVKAVLNARNLTALRNAAGSLLSTNLVGCRRPQSIVAFGAGKQIEAHLDLHLRFFPSIRTCTVINRSFNPRLTHLRTILESRFPRVALEFLTSSDDRDAERRKRAVEIAAIIICATSSTAPLFPSSWVRTGAHVILIGSYTPDMRECDSELVLRAIRPPSAAKGGIEGGRILLVDSRDACAREAGELIEAGVDFEKEVVEIGEMVEFGEDGNVVLDEESSRGGGEGGCGSEGGITMFKSVGVGLQDVAMACAVVKKAEEMGLGTRLDGYDS